jgi:hypothetical protein
MTLDNGDWRGRRSEAMRVNAELIATFRGAGRSKQNQVILDYMHRIQKKQAEFLPLDHTMTGHWSRRAELRFPIMNRRATP